MSNVQKTPKSTNIVVYETTNPFPYVEDDLTASVGLNKPDAWPAVMKWPPQKLVKAIQKGKISKENSGKFQEYYNKYALLTRKQAESFDEHIKLHGAKSEDLEGPRFLRIKKRFDYDRTANHNHIAFAFMLDPEGDYRNGYDQHVMSIGRTSLTTLDGGRLEVSENNINIPKHSQMAAQIMVEEALARGWGSIDVKGNKKVVMEIMKHAKAKGLEVNATFTGIHGLVYKPIKNMEVLDMDADAHKELRDILNDTAKDETPQKPPQIVVDSDPDNDDFGPATGPEGPAQT